MVKDEKTLYKLNDEIYFRKCSLFEEGDYYSYGDCTNFNTRPFNWDDKYYSCNQFGLHFHCAKHKSLEMDFVEEGSEYYLLCPICNNKILTGSLEKLRHKCLAMLNSEEFKNAKFIRLDDFYVPEAKDKKEGSEYWVKTEVKTDKDGDTIVVIYVGNKNTNQKAQFFIKPEKLQLSSDHNDLDPATILSKIELTLKDRTITQTYENEI